MMASLTVELRPVSLGFTIKRTWTTEFHASCRLKGRNDYLTLGLLWLWRYSSVGGECVEGCEGLP